MSNSSSVVNVKDFGARGDGVQDDSPFIQQAIKTLAADRQLQPGGVIWFPTGRYSIASPIVLPPTREDTGAASGGLFRLIGASKQGSVLVPQVENMTAIQLDTTRGVDPENIDYEVSNLGIEIAGEGIGIHIRRSSRAHIHRCKILTREDSHLKGTAILLDDFDSQGVNSDGCYLHSIEGNVLGDWYRAPRRVLQTIAWLDYKQTSRQSFVVGDIVRGSESNATAIIVNITFCPLPDHNNAPCLVVCPIEGEFGGKTGAEEIVAGSAKAVLTDTLTYASMNAIQFHGNWVNCNNPISVPNGGGNVYSNNLFQSAVGGTYVTPGDASMGINPQTGVALTLGGSALVHGNYFEQYELVYQPVRPDALLKSVNNHFDACLATDYLAIQLKPFRAATAAESDSGIHASELREDSQLFQPFPPHQPFKPFKPPARFASLAHGQNPRVNGTQIIAQASFLHISADKALENRDSRPLCHFTTLYATVNQDVKVFGNAFRFVLSNGLFQTDKDGNVDEQDYIVTIDFGVHGERVYPGIDENDESLPRTEQMKAKMRIMRFGRREQERSDVNQYQAASFLFDGQLWCCLWATQSRIASS